LAGAIKADDMSAQDGLGITPQQAVHDIARAFAR
jgi:hypothetical protein